MQKEYSWTRATPVFVVIWICCNDHWLTTRRAGVSKTACTRPEQPQSILFASLPMYIRSISRNLFLWITAGRALLDDASHSGSAAHVIRAVSPSLRHYPHLVTVEVNRSAVTHAHFFSKRFLCMQHLNAPCTNFRASRLLPEDVKNHWDSNV